MTTTKRRGKIRQATVSLGSDLRIGRAREVFDALVAQEKSSVVVIDAADVNKVDAAGVQLLVAAIVRYRTAGAKWRWHNLNPSLSNAARLLGLSDALEMK